MNRRIVLGATVGLMLGGPALSARADDSLYRDLGGQQKIAAFTDDFVNRLVRDDRIKARFANANIPHLKEKLVEQFSALAGGPVQYDGLGMKAAHASMGLRNADFNALAEDLQSAMDAAGIPFFTQNRLLALLAPMQREIVTK